MTSLARMNAGDHMRVGRLSAVGVIHLVVGAVTTLLVIIWQPKEGDPLIFLSTAEKLAAGGVAYRDVTSEYPPLALVHVTLPRMLGGPSHANYQTIFSLISLALFVATLAIVYWIARQRWSTESSADSAAMFVGLGGACVPLIVWRFDILPAFLTAVALAAYVARRPGWTGLGLGLGAMAKIYPLFLGPVFVAAALVERRWREATLIVVAGAITVAVVLAGPTLVAGSNAFSYVLYQENRGVEVESIAGGLAALAAAFFHAPANIRLGFGAWQIQSGFLTGLTQPVNVFNAVVATFTILACGVSFVRDQRIFGRVQPVTLVKYLGATVLAVILVNKVLSPQYLVWLLPFAALLSGRKSLLLLAILLITTFIYPLNFSHLLSLARPEVAALNVRNLLLVVLFVWVVLPDGRAQVTTPEKGEAGLERSYVGDAAD